MNLSAFPLPSIPFPYKVLAAVLTAAALWGHGYMTGGDHANDRRAASDLKATIRAEKSRVAVAEKVGAVAGKFEAARTVRADKQEQLTIIAETHRETIPDTPECHIDPERVRLINRAFESQPHPGQPQGPVQPRDATAQRVPPGTGTLGDSERGPGE